MARIIIRQGTMVAVVMTVATATLLMGHAAHGAITSCDQLNSAMTPCIGYLLFGGSVSRECCAGVRSLADSTRTTQDRRTVCSCIKSLAAGFSDTVIDRASGLPGQCRISSPYKISPSTDCSTLK